MAIHPIDVTFHSQTQNLNLIVMLEDVRLSPKSTGVDSSQDQEWLHTANMQAINSQLLSVISEVCRRFSCGEESGGEWSGGGGEE